MAEYSDYQKKIIKRFYDNRPDTDRQRLGELVTSLYLSSPGKKRQNLWKSIEECMGRLNVPATRIKHVMASEDAAQVAEVVQDLERGLFPPPPAGGPGSQVSKSE